MFDVVHVAFHLGLDVTQPDGVLLTCDRDGCDQKTECYCGDGDGAPPGKTGGGADEFEQVGDPTGWCDPVVQAEFGQLAWYDTHSSTEGFGDGGSCGSIHIAQLFGQSGRHLRGFRLQSRDGIGSCLLCGMQAFGQGGFNVVDRGLGRLAQIVDSIDDLLLFCLDFRRER